MSDSKTLADRVVWLFIGPKGVRLPWSILLAFMAFVAAQVLSFVVLHAAGVSLSDTREATTSLSTIKNTSLVLACVIAATLFMAVIEKRPLDDYYLVGARPVLRALQGAGVGLALISLLVGGEVALGVMRFDGFATRGEAALLSGTLWAGGFVLVGLIEEMMTRGYLLARLARSLGFRWGAIITTVFFSALHLPNPGESVIGIAAVVLSGLVFCFAIWKTGSIWWGFGWHAAWDWGETYLYGAPDSGLPANGSLMIMRAHSPDWLSGGATGPEGSVLCFIALGLAALTVHYLLPKRADLSGSRGATQA
ncbi:MAG: CPBP family intramembrane metalloprotease [Proteobacteria bacterium]|nr:CPBP family intramembrane metalloprotease [Pseudomonadota bacterium]